MSRPTWDELKLSRDGHLSGSKADPMGVPLSVGRIGVTEAYVHPLHGSEEILPSGNVLTTYHDGSAIEWRATR